MIVLVPVSVFASAPLSRCDSVPVWLSRRRCPGLCRWSPVVALVWRGPVPVWSPLDSFGLARSCSGWGWRGSACCCLPLGPSRACEESSSSPSSPSTSTDGKEEPEGAAPAEVACAEGEGGEEELGGESDLVEEVEADAGAAGSAAQPQATAHKPAATSQAPAASSATSASSAPSTAWASAAEMAAAIWSFDFADPVGRMVAACARARCAEVALVPGWGRSGGWWGRVGVVLI